MISQRFRTGIPLLTICRDMSIVISRVAAALYSGEMSSWMFAWDVRNFSRALKYSTACKEKIDLRMTVDGRSVKLLPSPILCLVPLFDSKQILATISNDRLLARVSSLISLKIESSSPLMTTWFFFYQGVMVKAASGLYLCLFLHLKDPY